ncbi:uncharacterized protein PgNI_07857 [Pyricularia grisea]|uniref:Uncharacterized protein n=1 Tax=Pyricularia grisea TaxID=148305 RepID=A0A6P8B2D7_PYRGI|nr:uncharacterized protein PgNI_07857 [Pyricularia grisea]TLD09016.1 hypothetical protein PgNI_07857 [Pyricularia grisea]
MIFWQFHGVAQTAAPIPKTVTPAAETPTPQRNVPLPRTHRITEPRVAPLPKTREFPLPPKTRRVAPLAEAHSQRVDVWARADDQTILAAAYDPESQAKKTLLEVLSHAGVDNHVNSVRLDKFLRDVRHHDQQHELRDLQQNQPQNKPSAVERQSQQHPENHARFQNVQPQTSPLLGFDSSFKAAAPAPELSSRSANQNHTENKWILVVDSANGARSIAAQYYLEVIRKMTMRSHKRWLFRRVESASYQPISDQVDTEPSAAIMTAAARDNYLCSGTFNIVPKDEVAAIRLRISNRESKFVKDEDLHRFHHIICFTREAKINLAIRLRRLCRDVWMNKIHYLQGCEGYSDTVSTPDAPWDRLSVDVSSALAPFLLSVLGRQPTFHEPIQDWWRTVEVQTSGVVLTAEQMVRWEHIWSEKQCKMHYLTYLNAHLFFVSGPPDKVTASQVKKELEAVQTTIGMTFD